MSLSLRDELRVVFCRDRVLMVRIGRSLTRRGIAYSMLEQITIELAAEGAAHSPEEAMKMLADAISALPKKPALAQVVISNHFMRYAVVGCDDSLSNAAEEQAYVKHRFTQLYGQDAETWEYRLDDGSEGATRLACAVDGRLMQALREVFKQAGVKLVSVQPHLMKAFNNSHGELRAQPVWFVTYSDGRLCIGVVEQGEWRDMRIVRVGEEWIGRLPEILDREAYLMEAGTNPEHVCLWSPEHWQTDLPAHERWKFRMLRPVIRPAFADGYDVSFAIALCG